MVRLPGWCAAGKTAPFSSGAGGAETSRPRKSQALGAFSSGKTYIIILFFKKAYNGDKLSLKKQVWQQGCLLLAIPPFLTDLVGSDRDRSWDSNHERGKAASASGGAGWNYA